MSISGKLSFSFPRKHGKTQALFIVPRHRENNQWVESLFQHIGNVCILTLCVSRLKQNTAEQISTLVAQQRLEMDQLRAGHAQDHSSSRVAQLSNRLNTQEVRPGRRTADPDTYTYSGLFWSACVFVLMIHFHVCRSWCSIWESRWKTWRQPRTHWPCPKYERKRCKLK